MLLGLLHILLHQSIDSKTNIAGHNKIMVTYTIQKANEFQMNQIKQRLQGEMQKVPATQQKSEKICWHAAIPYKYRLKSQNSQY